MNRPLPTWKTENIDSLSRFSKIRLVALDLDGTMIRSGESHLYKKIRRLKRSLKTRGHVDLILSTGRTLTGVQTLVDQLKLPKGLPLILYNGGVVVRNGTYDSIYKKTISAECLEEVLRIVSPFQVCTLAYIYDRTASKLFGMPNRYEYVLGWSELDPIKYEFNGMEISWQQSYTVRKDLAPSAILIDTSSNCLFVSAIENALKKVSDISVTRSGTSFIEIRPEGSNKGAALECVANYLKFSQEEVLALGDNDNDIEMLAWAGTGVAVAAASPAAIENSDYVCQYGVAEGAVELLTLIKTAKRYDMPVQ